MLIVLAGICLAIAVYFVGDAVTLVGRRRRTAIESVTDYVPIRPSEQLRGRRLQPTHLRIPFADALGRIGLRLTSEKMRTTLETRLALSGLSPRISITTYLALKTLLGVSGFFLGILLGGVAGVGGRSILIGIVLAGFGFLGPELIVAGRARRRQEQIQGDFPTALELLAISVEAGLALDGAISMLTKHLESPVTDEFSYVLAEMRVGETRSEAVKRLAQRVPVPEMAFFSNAVIQGDRLGMSLGRIMRTLAGDSRRRRQLAAEERANKLPVKMLFPLAIFILPTMFIVILGPALINIFGL